MCQRDGEVVGAVVVEVNGCLLPDRERADHAAELCASPGCWTPLGSTPPSREPNVRSFSWAT
jgi:hypothetical protein